MHPFARRGLLALAFLFAIWILPSLFYFPGLATQVGNNPVTTTPGELGLQYEEVIVPSGELNLVGWWIPAPEPRAVMLFAHGAGSNRTSWFLPSLAFYRTMTEMGVSVLTIDLRNHGNSPHSDGKLGMGRTEWPDLVAAAAWLDAQGHTELPRLAMGLSMGGATAVYALHRGLSVNALLLLDPLLNTRDALAYGGWIAYGLPSWLFQPMAWATVTLGTLPSLDADAGVLAATLDVPTLLIQDASDPITRLPFAERLAADNPMVTLAIAPDTPQDADCLENKGRWGTHVAAFKCHPEWTRSRLEDFLARVLSEAPLSAQR